MAAGGYNFRRIFAWIAALFCALVALSGNVDQTPQINTVTA